MLQHRLPVNVPGWCLLSVVKCWFHHVHKFVTTVTNACFSWDGSRVVQPVTIAVVTEHVPVAVVTEHVPVAVVTELVTVAVVTELVTEDRARC
ncbi:hypothetical protein CYMTET_4779 [Cymbomonas tetramitiformis]|uniref:Uncharacterized protein n=1 Tax=Cymbomonas tetramitiformis TaxID=36881 RepID=A0AAE0H0Q3_9CHLO|nr:hypothetical protein CYMTET_4779 [Cymbomonas tetramitiformis]